MARNNLVTVAAVACLFFLPVFASAESDVLVLDESNFQDAIAKHDFLVVEFYAPWCGHCKNLAPEYEKAASELKGSDPEIVLASVNADDEKNKKLAADYGVRGYPTLKIIRKGNIVEDYKGPREADGIVSYLKKQVGPATTELTGSEDAGDFVGKNSVAIIGVFKSYDSDEFKVFKELADKLRSEFDFRHTLDGSVLPLKDEPLAAPAIRLFKTFDERFNDFSEFDIEKLQKFIEEFSLPNVVELNQDPEMQPFLTKFFNAPSSKVFFFLNYNESDTDEYREALKDAAVTNKAKGVGFLIANAAENEHALEYFGLSSGKLPAIVIQDLSNKKYIEENIEASKIKNFVQEFLAGNLKERIKSEPVPEKNDEPVKVVVRDSLEDFVLKSGKTVLLEFYAPWCGHCKKLAPILEEVAVHFKDAPDVMIAKLDATTNDVPEELFDVKGFPTLYLYTSGKQIVSYDGDRSKEDLISFVEKNREASPAVEEPKEQGSDQLKDEL